MSYIGVEDALYEAEAIICEDIRFEDRKGWCLMTLLFDDAIADANEIYICAKVLNELNVIAKI